MNLIDVVSAVESAEGIFTGGGNTFVFHKLYMNNNTTVLEETVKKRNPYLEQVQRHFAD
jgi:dipeptidase E